MITPVSPRYLKQVAKKLKKSVGLSMSKALDEVSKNHGFSNYRHYLNVFESNLNQSKDSILKYIEHFKLQADNLFADYNTQTPYFDDVIEGYLYQYSPRHFDFEEIVMQFDVDEENFNLKDAQNIIAYFSGFIKWTDLLKASESELKLAKLLLDNKETINIEDWEMYIVGVEDVLDEALDPESKINIFNEVYLNV